MLTVVVVMVVVVVVLVHLTVGTSVILRIGSSDSIAPGQGPDLSFLQPYPKNSIPGTEAVS